MRQHKASFRQISKMYSHFFKCKSRTVKNYQLLGFIYKHILCEDLLTGVVGKLDSIGPFIQLRTKIFLSYLRHKTNF